MAGNANSGRKPLPKEIKKLRNTLRNFRENHDAPQPPRSSNLEPPSYLGALASAEYIRKAELLHKMGVFCEGDDVALAAYAEAYARWVNAVKTLKRTGPLIEGSDGVIVRNPILMVLNSSMEQMHKFLTEFGLTPVSRTRIKVDSQNKDTEWSDFGIDDLPQINSSQSLQ